MDYSPFVQGEKGMPPTDPRNDGIYCPLPLGKLDLAQQLNSPHPHRALPA